jgi:hypothetical protein
MKIVGYLTKENYKLYDFNTRKELLVPQSQNYMETFTNSRTESLWSTKTSF